MIHENGSKAAPDSCAARLRAEVKLGVMPAAASLPLVRVGNLWRRNGGGRFRDTAYAPWRPEGPGTAAPDVPTLIFDHDQRIATRCQRRPEVVRRRRNRWDLLVAGEVSWRRL